MQWIVDGVCRIPCDDELYIGLQWQGCNGTANKPHFNNQIRLRVLQGDQRSTDSTSTIGNSLSACVGQWSPVFSGVVLVSCPQHTGQLALKHSDLYPDNTQEAYCSIGAWWLSRWRNHLQCWRTGFNLWDGKILWKRKWQPTAVFLPGKSHGWRSLAGYSPWGRKSWIWI